MSQTITIQGTKKGAEIQEHLESMYDEVISETFGKRVKTISDMDEMDAISCQVCGSYQIQIIWSTEYSGYRGFCTHCKHNWPES